jgi:hypothetical protein
LSTRGVHQQFQRRAAGGAFRPEDGLRRKEGLKIHPHFNRVAFFFGFGGGRNPNPFHGIIRQEFLDATSFRNHHGPGAEQRQGTLEVLQRHSRLKSDGRDFPLGKLHLQVGQVGG